MSRSKTRRWVRLVAGLLLGTVAPTAQAVFFPEPGESVSAPPAVRPSQAHIALNKAIECQRLGDYETAAPLFREAMTQQANLTLTERQELVRLQLDNSEALAARRVGAEQLRLAEKAFQDGRRAEADEKLKYVAANEQYLTPSDRQRFQQLANQGRPHPAAAPTDAGSKARHVLNNAIECHRRGDYENAVVLFRDAQAQQASLTAAERQELARVQLDNGEALAARRVGAEQLRQAEKAVQDGHADEAAGKLKYLAANEQYLTLNDRLLFQQLQGGKAQPRSNTPPLDAATQARARVQQARKQIELYDFDAAERLAREAENMGFAFGPAEDSPKRVLLDVAGARGDAKTLLVAARAAVNRGDWRAAETFARLADQNRTRFTFPIWASDSPSRVLKDIEAARKQQASTAQPEVKPEIPIQTISATSESAKPVALNPDSASPVPPLPNAANPGTLPKTEGSAGNATKSVVPESPSARSDAKTLLAAARDALKRGDFDRAENYAKLADQNSSSMTFPPWASDSPSKVLKDIDASRKQQALTAKPEVKPSNPIQVVATTPDSAKPETTPVVKQLPDAASPGTTPKADPNVPSAGSDARTLLASARTALQRGDFDRAESYAKLSQQNGSTMIFPPWASDSPSKVLKEIDDARKQRGLTAKPEVKPSNPIQVVSTNPESGKPDAPKLDPTKPVQKQPDVASQGSPPKSDGPVVATPKSVVPDVPSPRNDAKALLAAAREALKRSDYDRAEFFAKQSDEYGSSMTFPPWASDSPTKVLKDIDTARKHSLVAKQEPKPVAPKPQNIEEVRTLLAQARQEMQDGKLKESRKNAEKARSMSENFKLLDSGAETLLVEIDRAGTGAAQTAQLPTPADHNAPPTTTAPKVENKEQAVALLRQGRSQFDGGKLDDAIAVAVRLKGMNQFKWGLFEDTPDKLQADVEKVQHKRGQDDSVKVLAEARRLLEKGDYKAATDAAYSAAKLHGAYTMWDFGDRPSKLLTDIDVARAHDHKVVVPPAEAIVNNTQKGEIEARQLLAEARLALKNNDLDKARKLAERVVNMNVTLNKPDDDTPAAILRDITLAARTPPSPAPIVTPKPVEVATNPLIPPAPLEVATNPLIPPAPTIAAPDPAKIRALQLLTDARKLQGEGKFAEALQKVAESRQLGGTFGPEEDNPDLVAQQLAAVARKRIESLVRSADETMSYAGNDPQLRQPLFRYQKAEGLLTEASQLTALFRQDAQPITYRLDRVRDRVRNLQKTALTATTPPSPVETVVAAPPPKPLNQGEVLLQKARLELRSGATVTARRLAEEAIAGNYGVQKEAEDLLRSIGGEETNQHAFELARTFDAAVQAYNRGDFKYALVLFGEIDYHLLDEQRQTRFRELMQTAQMQPGNQTPTVAVKPGSYPAAAPGSAEASQVRFDPKTPGKALASDGVENSLLDSMSALREVKFQKLRQIGLDAQRDASEKFKTGQTDAALEMLQAYLNQLRDEQLSTNQLALLKRPIETRLESYKLMKSNRDFVANEANSVKSQKDNRSKLVLAEEKKQKNMAELMNRYNALMKETKYDEAVAVALQMRDLDPDSQTAAGAYTIAKRQGIIKENDRIKNGKEEYNRNVLNQAEEPTNPEAIQGEGFDRKRWTMVGNRTMLPFNIPRHNSAEREVERRLNLPTSLNFQNMPLKQAIDDLRQMHNLNIYVDEQALAEKGIGQDRPVTIKLDGVALKSALNLMLKNLGLTYIIDEGTLQITTPDRARGKMGLATHYVADLVIPVGNFATLPYATPGQPNPSAAPNPLPVGTPGYPAPTPMTPPFGLPGGASTGSSSIGGPTGTPDVSGGNWSRTSPGSTQERELMRLITNVVSPQSWTELGGPGTIDYHPLTMSLVVNQTPDIQEQIAELLAALRRLQDQEVSVEVKFISVSDTFYERIGVNFSANIATGNQQYQPALNNGVFTPQGFINQFQPKNFVSGATAAGTLTSDLGIPITNNTFFQTLPSIGGYPGIGVGGITTGLAFLSDIQVFLFLEAVSGDTRTHVTQAPKLTLFNGQTATLSVQTSQVFLTSVSLIPNVGNGNPAFIPAQVVLPLGVNLTLQAVITADRKFVRLSLNPTLTNLVPGPVNTFPVVVPIFPTVPVDGVTPNPLTLTQLLQQPITQTINVTTTVLVPDGGTVLLGGLKRLAETRSESGPPIISDIPIINRLFKNVGFGRETESLLLMVTPRIIIQEEEEFRQTGYLRPVEQNAP